MAAKNDFELRDESGVLIASFDARIMSVITKCSGEWRPYTPKNKKSSVCFVIAEDMKFDLSTINIPMALFIWAGYKVIAV